MEKRVPRHIRRSLIALSMADPQLGEKAYASWADAIVLDLVKARGSDWQLDLKSKMPAAIYAASRGGAEVFVRTSRAAQIESVAFEGLAGIVVRGVGDAATVANASERLDAIEESRGIARGSIELCVEITTAAGLWNSLDIARASPRVASFTIDERELSCDLGMSCEPVDAFEPLEYVKSQIITVATSVGGQAQGMSYPLSLTQAEAADAELCMAVRRARDTGFKGAVCAHPSWVAACNEGFRPSAEETAYYVKVREVFAEGLKRGMASVPIDGKMVDVPVDVRAKLYLDWARRADARDEEKNRAHATRVIPYPR